MSLSKERIRADVRARLKSLSAGERASLGARIHDRIWSLPEVNAARVLLLYASMPSEVPTDRVAEEAWNRGITVVFPLCPPASPLMTLHRIDAPDELVLGGRYAVREPRPEAPSVALAQVDLAFIPGLAWDRAGGRLGRGAGFYDRLLAQTDWRAKRFGLFFALQEVPLIPTDPWDQPLDGVITEREVIQRIEYRIQNTE
jgi:5-formyltetrahydrofolate cyclo-ligase